VGFRIFTAAERPDLNADADEFTHAVWPEYNLHGDVMGRYWGRLDEAFSEFQFVLLDEEAEAVVAQGHTIPCRWDGTADGLPAGIDGVIEHGFDLLDRGERSNALSALGVEIMPDWQGRGLSETMIEGMRAIARRHRLRTLIAPVRPTWKERYPLTPIERYAAWRREDGLPFDPWMRVHARLGAEVVKPEPRSLRITASVEEWEGWTGMRFPETGDYVFPHGLAPLSVDLETDVGTYWEPNVWMAHRPR
jgi:GNAT superfamily N-acetyltransferase